MGYLFNEAAVPSIQEGKCTGCGQCAAVCSTGSLAMENGQVRVAKRMFMGCIACGQCMAVCPSDAITVRGRRLDPDDVVSLPPGETRATAEQLDGLLLGRRSIRQFAEKEVDRRLVDRILEMTSTAPMGIPPSGVGIVVFHGREKVQAFAEDAVACFRTVVKFFHPVVLGLMRPFLGKAQYEVMRGFVRPLLEVIVDHWDAGLDAFAYRAPLAMLFHHTPQSDPVDAAIAATYAMLAAESLGLGSCMLGTPIALDRNRSFKQKHGIPKENKIGLGLVMGYADAHFRQSIRRKFESVTFA